MQCHFVTLSPVSLKLEKKAFKKFEKKTDELTDMHEFLEFPSFSLECSSVVATIQVVCCLYQENKETSNINELWHELFTKKSLFGYRLPSTLDALVFRLRRGNYQTYIWESACVPILNLPSPIEDGRQMEDGKICEELNLNFLSARCCCSMDEV